jgi:hypothetical protein
VSAFKHLSHEFLIVSGPSDGFAYGGATEYIVDPRFREQFDIPQVCLQAARPLLCDRLICHKQHQYAGSMHTDTAVFALVYYTLHVSNSALMRLQTVAWYDELLLSVPEAYTGPPARLRSLVKVLSAEMASAFAAAGAVTPPWRSAGEDNHYPQYSAQSAAASLHTWSTGNSLSGADNWMVLGLQQLK